MSGPHTVHLVMSEGSVRFWELATLFRDVLGCPAALYLDGIVSGLRAEGLPESMGVTSRYGGILAVTAPLVPSPDPGAVGPDRPPATPSGPQPTPGDTE